MVKPKRASGVGAVGNGVAIRRSSRSRSSVTRFVAGSATLSDSYSFESPRFHLVPANGWHRFLWQMRCALAAEHPAAE